ncbi:MAG: hypothetical protein AAF560_12870 [Acidobacteriota bacterium]
MRWLSLKGFELSDRPVLFDLDGDSERCAFLVSNERWTLLFFSRYEEERRLIRELQRDVLELLYIWVQDSDVWGYDLIDGDGFVASFNSDPRSFRSFADEPGERPEADPGLVCQRLDLSGQEDALRRIHRLNSVFSEDACIELCRLIGAEAALTSYDDLERGATDHLEGWHIEQLHFVRSESRRDETVDLHELHLGGRDGLATRSFRVQRFEIPPEVLAEAERRRKRVRWTIYVLRPLSWLARSWRSLLQALAPSRKPVVTPPLELAPVGEPSRVESSDIIEVRHLINERHRCRIRLAIGGETQSGSAKPASVFAFQIAETAVTCTARRRSRIREVLQQPSNSKVLRDEKYQIGGLKARHILFELPPLFLAGTTGPSYLGLHVVQTELALYVFLYRFQTKVLKEVERAIRSTVGSFRLLT